MGRDEQGIQPGSAERRAGRIGHRQLDDAVNLAARCKPYQFTAADHARPDAAVGIYRGTVRTPDLMRPVLEDAAVAERSVADVVVERPRHLVMRVRKIHGAIVGTPAQRVG